MNPVPPAMDREACVKISIYGYPVGVVSAASMSPMQYRIAMSIANPMSPFMRIEANAKSVSHPMRAVSSLEWDIAPVLRGALR
jgi:hypothetical protein